MAEIRPQPGPQANFLASEADIAIFGGAAGGGKSFALLLETLRHTNNKNFGTVVFRRTFPEIANEGGLWSESEKLYPHLGATPRTHANEWNFPSGATVSFRHLQHDKDKLNWSGAQIPLLCFDELTLFEESQFWFLLSRNRSTCGVRPYVRATCNPDGGSWVADLLSWWIDQDSGYPIAERAGKVRWFIRDGSDLAWADTAAELEQRFPELRPKSLAFFPAKLSDNAVLMAKDPGYLANLLALPLVERERLLGGNWKIRDGDREWPDSYFGPHIWFDEWPTDLAIKAIALDPSKGANAKFGDYSAIVRLGRSTDGTLWCEADLVRRRTEQIVEDAIEHQRLFQADVFAVETNQFQELLATQIAAVSKARGIMVPVAGYDNRVNKQVRIRRLGPYLAKLGIRFKANSPGTRLLVQQLRDFPVADHDDGPDALELALRAMIDLHNGRVQRKGPQKVRA